MPPISTKKLPNQYGGASSRGVQVWGPPVGRAQQVGSGLGLYPSAAHYTYQELAKQGLIGGYRGGGTQPTLGRLAVIVL